MRIKVERFSKKWNFPFSQLQLTIEEGLISIVLVLHEHYKLQVARHDDAIEKYNQAELKKAE